MDREQRIPPQDREAERSVLGSVLRENTVLNDIVPLLPRGAFYFDAHQRVYAAMLKLFDSGRPIDLVILAEELKAHVEDIGGYGFLGELWEAAPTAANAQYYAGIVRDKWLARTIIHECTDILRDAYESAMPGEELLGQFQARAMALGSAQQGRGTSKLKDVGNKALQRIEDRYQNRGKCLYPETGLIDLDDLLRGFRPGELVIVAARPSVGKTAFAVQVAKFAAQSGFHPLIFSLEQQDIELAERMLCGESRVNSGRVRAGDKLTGADFLALTAARNELAKLNVTISDKSSQTVREILATARRVKASEGLGLVVIDYLTLIATSGATNKNRAEVVAEMTRGIKLMARDLQVPVILLSQLNRAPANEKRKPLLNDLRDSGAIEQDADTVLLLHRENEPSPELELDDIELVVAKQRNGPPGPVKLWYRKATFTFENRAVGEVAM